jgi:hypothetical protein
MHLYSFGKNDTLVFLVVSFRKGLGENSSSLFLDRCFFEFTSCFPSGLPLLFAYWPQENYFFDGSAQELGSRRAVLRIRFYDTDRKAVLTLKVRRRVWALLSCNRARSRC